MKALYTGRSAVRIVSAALSLFLVSTLAFAASGTWSPTGAMRSPRDGHTATLLSNGNVLAAGGTNNGIALNSAEIYNAASGTWAYTGSMSVARTHGRALMLGNGLVLVMGGCVDDCLSSTTASAELYNPASGSFTTTGSMHAGRAEFGAVVLDNGQVLVAGGCTKYDVNGCAAVTSGAELYNPSTGTWRSTAALRAARYGVTASLISTGKVLVAGGSTAATDALSSSELYDPTAGTWALSGKMVTPRSDYASVVLSNGLVLYSGGENISGVSTNKAETYNPTTGKFTGTGTMTGSRVEHTAVVLPNGNVLVSGGNYQTAGGATPLSTAEIYNPSTKKWTATGSMTDARAGHTSTRLATGTVLNSGGSNAVNELSSAEIYTP